MARHRQRTTEHQLVRLGPASLKVQLPTGPLPGRVDIKPLADDRHRPRPELDRLLCLLQAPRIVSSAYGCHIDNARIPLYRLSLSRRMTATYSLRLLC
jgi:hypothetical protein